MGKVWASSMGDGYSDCWLIDTEKAQIVYLNGKSVCLRSVKCKFGSTAPAFSHLPKKNVIQKTVCSMSKCSDDDETGLRCLADKSIPEQDLIKVVDDKGQPIITDEIPVIKLDRGQFMDKNPGSRQ